MASYILFYNEEDDLVATDIALMDAMVVAFDMEWMTIDRLGTMSRSRLAHSSLDLARASFPDHDWWFFFPEESIPSGTAYEHLEDVIHPADNVIYAIGSNTDGFRKTPAELKPRGRDKIITMGKGNGGLYAQVCALAISYDRWLKRWRGL